MQDDQTKQPTRGVIYAATGEAYLETARRSARSMRKHNPDLHITLFSDIEDTSGAFDQTRLLKGAHARSKVDAICDTPYEQTLYLDCDTLIRSDLTHMFALLERFDIAIANVVMWENPSHRMTWKTKVPDAFAEPNTGVILYHTTGKMVQFLKDWKAAFYDLDHFNDQVTMREMLWTSDVAYYVLQQQYNKRMFEASELIYSDQPKAKLLHLELLRPQKNPIMRWLADRVR